MFVHQCNIYDKNQWRIKLYYKSQHGALIIGEYQHGTDNGYLFLNITKNPPNGYSYYETKQSISRNITEKSYIRFYVQRDKKKYFSKWDMNFELSEADLTAIENFIKKKSATCALSV